MKFVAGRHCRSTLGYAFDERFVYELELKNVTRRISKYDFIMRNYRLPNRGIEFDHFKFFCENAPNQYKRYVEPPGNMVGHDFQNNSYIKYFLVLNKEKEIKKFILILHKR